MKKKLLLISAIALSAGSMLAQPTQFSEPQLFIKSSQSLMCPVWSPDGSKIAVTGDNFIGIWVANADGSSLEQVSHALGAGYKMQWSDAQNIVSTPYELQNNRRMTRIEQVNVATGAVKQVAAATRNLAPSKAMKRTNSVLRLMVDNPFGATSQIASLRAYAGKAVLNPALSPDGSKIAFQIESNGLWVCNADGTNAVSLGKGSHPAWMPDNQTLVITRIEDDGERFTASDLYCLNIATLKEVNITPNSNVIPVTLSVSPDGTKVAFDNDADGCIYLINIK